MQTTLENLGELTRRLNVAVPLADVESEVKKRLGRLAKTVKLPGFRPGHVPMKMITQQYGPQVRSDVISDAVRKSFDEAVRTQNLRVAGYPRIEPRAGDAPAPDAIEFSAVFEVYPEVGTPDVSGLAIERPDVSVEAADVDRTLEVLRKQRATWQDAGRPAQKGDRVVVDFTGTIDGVEFPGGQAKDFTVELGEGRMLPEFEGALAGADRGRPRHVSADVSRRTTTARMSRARPRSSSLDVRQVLAAEFPPLDDAFAKAFGIASGRLDDLRAEVSANLQLELKRKVESVVKEQVFSGLRSLATFALPKSLVEIESQGMLERMAHDLRQQGMKPDDIQLKPEMFRAQAENRVALGLVVGELVRAQNLAAKPEQVKAIVAEMAQTYEQPEAVVRWHFEKPERLAEFESLAIERNVVDWVLSRAKVAAKPTDFETLMGPARG